MTQGCPETIESPRKPVLRDPSRAILATRVPPVLGLWGPQTGLQGDVLAPVSADRLGAAAGSASGVARGSGRAPGPGGQA